MTTTWRPTSGTVIGVPHDGTGGDFAVPDPATGQVLTRYRLATAADLDTAVTEARRAFG
jgi:acyl-CoA reductase-like NAD-dependent aldehyde dehydrogenase